MLLGRVRHVGGKLPDPHASLRPGERVATLVSLSLTPLQIERILSVNLHAHQVSILGTAILFDSGSWARLPPSLPESVALSALDVAGAAPQVTRLCHDPRPGKRVDASWFSARAENQDFSSEPPRKGRRKTIIGVESYAKAASEAESLGIYDQIVRKDAADA